MLLREKLKKITIIRNLVIKIRYVFNRLYIFSVPVSIRWKIAQYYENKHWQIKYHKGEKGKTGAEFQKARISYIQNRDSTFFDLNKIRFDDKTIVEIGSGPTGLIFTLEGKKRYAVDPLMDQYKKLYDFSNQQNLELIAAQGEHMPIKSNIADMVICTNVLDHVQNPKLLISEAFRLLKKNGDFFLGTSVNKVENYEHPYNIKQQELTSWLENIGFTITDMKLSKGKFAGSGEDLGLTCKK